MRGAAGEGAVVALFFIVYGSRCSPLCCLAEVSPHGGGPGSGKYKTKTLHLLRRNLGANDTDTTIREFSHFYIELS